jgi:ATP-binding cassette subfamily B protein
VLGSLGKRVGWSSRVALVRELPRISVPMTAGYALVTVALAVLPTATMVANGVLVGRLPAAAGTGSGSAATGAALVALAVVGGLAVAAWTIESLGALLREHLARTASRRWDRELLEAMAEPATIAHLEDPAFLDRLEAASGRTRAGPAQAVALIGPVVARFSTGLLALVLVARFSGWLAVALLVQALVHRSHWRTRYDRITAAIFGAGDLHRRSGYLRALALTPPAAKELRVFGLATWVRDRFDGEWRAAMAPAWRRMREGWERSIGLSLLWAAIVAVGSWMVVTAAVDGRITLAVAVITLQAMMGADALGGVSDEQHQLAEGVERLRHHHAVVAELHRLASRDATPGAPPVPSGAPERRIAFRGVTFCYPGTGVPVLRDFDLEIEAGTSVAIVGSNGAGKTTLVKLLAGLHRPDAGTIEVDGMELSALDARSWHRRVSAIFQDFWRYPLSVRANIGLGAPEHLGDQSALERAASRAGAEAVIAGLSAGWDTVLDRQFDGGTELSGGQWQRLALARALFAVESGARVLVLDEPTAALDVRAEADVYDRFLDITTGLTSIVISHRFSTVRRADRIVVIEGGRIIEDGDHTSLLAAGGRYARMFQLQAARYRSDPTGEGDTGVPTGETEGVPA